jgi:hypothetical protein
MGRLPEPDEVDIIVDGRDYDPASHQETIEFIKQYKSRPEYAAELQQAKETLEALRMNSPNYQPVDPAELLAQWHRRVEELKQRESQQTVVSGESTESR